ncbi:MAG: sodium:calcium exchanger, partial [Trichodesmium sp. St2_bin6]|nr:sodium:calcium exchanger [Trichodesmium sp. St2_bin6]
KTVKVSYGTVDGSAKSGKDYQKTSGVLTFKPGQRKKILNVPILGDTRDEKNENFQVKLSGAKNAKLSDKNAVGVIRDNDETVPQISIGDAKVTEGNKGKKNMQFEVELNKGSSKTVKVSYGTVDGSAKSGKDYQKTSGVLTFKPGQRKKILNVPILGDTRDEKNEQFQVKLSGAKNAKLSDKNAVGVIRDNDEIIGKTPQISIKDAKITEGKKGEKDMKFEVKLDKSSSQIVRVNYETVDGSAKAGKDYEKKKGVLKFQPGETKKTVNISILGDTVDEKNENFRVKLSGAKNANLSDKNAIGIIRNNPVPESFKDAVDLGILSAEQTVVVDDIGFATGPVNRNTEDYFCFKVEKEGLVSIFVDGFIQDLGIKLYGDDESLLNQSNEKGNTT